MIRDLIDEIGAKRVLVGIGVACVTLFALIEGGFTAGLLVFGVFAVIWGIVEAIES